MFHISANFVLKPLSYATFRSWCNYHDSWVVMVWGNHDFSDKSNTVLAEFALCAHKLFWSVGRGHWTLRFQDRTVMTHGAWYWDLVSTNLTNPIMHLSYIPHYTIQNRNMDISVLNGSVGYGTSALWYLWFWSILMTPSDDNSHDSQIPIGIVASGSRDW